MKKQISIIVIYNGSNTHDTHSTEELNKLLKQGWIVASATPMGGGPSNNCIEPITFASLVILEKDKY